MVISHAKTLGYYFSYIAKKIMQLYNHPIEYIDTASNLEDKINKIELLITSMEDAAMRASLNEDIEEYWLDDGQTKIKNIYRNSNEILKSIFSLERLKNMYVSKLNGRTSVLKDINSMRGC